MPKLYSYLGIIIFFYSNEHEPIHVHGQCGGRETKAEIVFFNGKVKEIRLIDKGPGLEPKKRREFEDFVACHAEEISEKWIDFFIRKKPVTCKTITRKIKNARTVS